MADPRGRRDRADPARRRPHAVRRGDNRQRPVSHGPVIAAVCVVDAGYRPAGAVDVRPYGQALGRDLGQRCAGNTACTPICPIQAKYNAGKSLAQADPNKLQVVAQAVASYLRDDRAITATVRPPVATPGATRRSRLPAGAPAAPAKHPPPRTRRNV